MIPHLLIDAGVKGSALELIRFAGNVAVDLVAAVVAVYLTIATEVMLDALSSATTEFALRTVSHLAIEFIAAVAAIVLVVATPTSWYALGVVALEVRGITGGLGGVATGWLVLAIGTILLVITAPGKRYAATRVASTKKRITLVTFSLSLEH